MAKFLVISEYQDPPSRPSCIVIVLDMPFKRAPWPGALELYFTFYWLFPMQVRYRPLRSSCFIIQWKLKSEFHRLILVLGFTDVTFLLKKVLHITAYFNGQHYLRC